MNTATQNASTVDSLSELRVKVAELCGDFDKPTHKATVEELEAILNDPRQLRVTLLPNGEVYALPGYPSDLNACAAMREQLSEDEWYAFVDALLGKPWSSAWDWDDVVKLVSAPAEEQCRAFVFAKKASSVGRGTEKQDVAPGKPKSENPAASSQGGSRTADFLNKRGQP